MGGTKEEFASFYKFINPAVCREQKVTGANVDQILPFADYYQVESLKTECEDVLLQMPLSVERLIQADTHGLTRMRDKCMDDVARNFANADMKVLAKRGDLLLD